LTAASIATTLGGRRARRLPDGGYLTRCPLPSHGKGRGDRDPSLRLCDGDKELLVHCYSGCDPTLILGELRRRGLLGERREKSAKERKSGPSERRATASYMWRQSQALAGTIAETYLREVRGISCELPPSLRFLPAHKSYPPAMIAAFGLMLARIDAVHLTRLKPDGSKIEDSDELPSKMMVGAVSGQPIVLAEPNDLLGLAICEGIEDALSVHQSTGLGAWAAGSASHMAKLALTVPDYIEAVTIYADSDQAGQTAASALAVALRQRQPRPGERPIEVEIEGL
jgi:hypothetical protein